MYWSNINSVCKHFESIKAIFYVISWNDLQRVNCSGVEDAEVILWGKSYRAIPCISCDFITEKFDIWEKKTWEKQLSEAATCDMTCTLYTVLLHRTWPCPLLDEIISPENHMPKPIELACVTGTLFIRQVLCLIFYKVISSLRSLKLIYGSL